MSDRYTLELKQRLEPLYKFAHDVVDENCRQAKDLYAITSLVERSYPAFSQLIGKLQPGLCEQRWQSVLVDIRSADLPSIVLKTVASRIAQNTNTPCINFSQIAAGRHIPTDLVKAQLQDLNPDGRMLFFSEYIAKGGGLSRFVQSAVELDYDRFDVAIVNTGTPLSYYQEVVRGWRSISGSVAEDVSTEIYIGDETYRTERFHNPLFQAAAGFEVKAYGGELEIRELPVDTNIQYVARTALQGLGDVLYEQHFALR